MERIKYWSISLPLILIMQATYGQEMYYIATDSTLITGIQLIERSSRKNAQFIWLKEKNQGIKYYPDQLSEYGFKDGTVYESRSILVSGQIKQVFLERLEYGKINLYYYSEKGISTYYLEHDSTVLIEIKKNDDFRKMISEYMQDSDWKASQVLLTKYNGKSLSKLISYYNNSTNKPLPFPRFGIITGYNITSLIIPSSISIEQLDDISFSPSTAMSFGVFSDLPIEMSYFSLNVGLIFSKSGFSATSSSTPPVVDAVINYTSFNTPLLIRYTIPTLIWRPFVNAGGIYSYHLRNKSNIYESTIDQNVITINNFRRDLLMSKSMFGYSLGVGLQRNLNYKKIVALELRYDQLYGKEDTLNKRHVEIFTSFSF